MTYTKTKLELLLETERFPAIASCYSWGLNCESGRSPFELFLDLIGWSDETIGVSLYNHDGRIGFLEADYLADALKEWTTTGADAYDFANDLIAAESEEE